LFRSCALCFHPCISIFIVVFPLSTLQCIHPTPSLLSYHFATHHPTTLLHLSASPTRSLIAGPKFEHDLSHNLTRATAFEAVMRVRATRGIRFSNFYGNYFVRGTDLLALPNCTSDSSYSLDMAYDEATLTASAITVQAALLYTSSAGERRIRIHTTVIPVTHVRHLRCFALSINCCASHFIVSSVGGLYLFVCAF
jgi:hypothetical protein